MIYILALLLIADFALAVWVFILSKNIKNIFRGESGDLEKVLLSLRSKQDLSEKDYASLSGRVVVLEAALPKNLRRVGLVRYNPFPNAGGDQSFVIALLNDHKDGVVVTSLYGREVNRVYAKPIKGGKSQYQLTEEEKQAIDQAT